VQPKPLGSARAGCPTEDELARFVDKVANPSLITHVLSHLDACPNCRLLLAATLRSSEPPTSSIAVACMPHTFPLGEIVGGRYRIDRWIARGGMGEVYQAWDLQLRETIALKTIACTALDDAKFYRRIRKEVQLARRVAHPNVCRILEFGLHQQLYRGQKETIPFFTMEFLDGETLATHLGRQGQLSLPLFLQIASQILEGMSAIHAAGIVHRDLKPENICLLGHSGSDLRVIVMDFGLARLQENLGSAPDSSVSSAAGTPTYMAPEQSLGGIPNVKWDIFALGVIFFKAIAGQLPFKGGTTVALAMARIQEPAPLLSSIVPDVDPRVEAVITGCLERDPARRFASIEEVKRALVEVYTYPPPRGRLRVWALASLLLAAVTGVSAVLFLSSRHRILQAPASPDSVALLPAITESKHEDSRTPVAAEAAAPPRAASSAQPPLGENAARASVPLPVVAEVHHKPSVATEVATPSDGVSSTAEPPTTAAPPETAPSTSPPQNQPATTVPTARVPSKNNVEERVGF
jgi:serine/threonine protein kinase